MKKIIIATAIKSKKRDTKKLMIAAIVAVAFSPMANASLVDRINEARSYPNKTVETVSHKMLHVQQEKIDMKMHKAKYKNHSDSSSLDNKEQRRAQRPER
jgi:hypothetical protein